MDLDLGQFGALLTALTALSTAAFGLLDSTKAFGGGVSNLGKGHLQRALTPFAPALTQAVGPGWWDVVLANWLNGMPKPDQKARVAALLKLGLTRETAPVLAQGGRVDEKALTALAGKLANGAQLIDADLNVLGRLNATMEALLDHAFERAEQQYRNVSRFLAGVIAVALSLGAWVGWDMLVGNAARAPADKLVRPEFLTALAVGIVAVPLAPVAKDVTSALSAAMRALKTAKTI